jgi:hypothetical protein
MLSPKEHLAYLVELAAEPGERRELVRELAELLTAWPADYPIEARPAFAALLARVEHDIDPDARHELAVKLADCADAPLALLNEFFFDLPPASHGKVLARDALIATEPTARVNEAALVAAARAKRGTDFAHVFAATFGIDSLTAMEILQDARGTGMAIVCRGTGLSRAAFSTLAVLTPRGDVTARLAAFDTVPEKGAAALLAFWRRQAVQHAHSQAA